MAKRKSKTNTGDFSGEGTSIFSSNSTMTSAEREAVKKGEKRGEAEAMKERPEYYGNIGSLNPIKCYKSKSLMAGDCKRNDGCPHYTGSDDMKFCNLPDNKRCIR